MNIAASRERAAQKTKNEDKQHRGGISALLYACQQGQVDLVQRILRAKPSALAERDRSGKTALHYCCISDNISSAQAADLLVMAAPDLVEQRDDEGFTPLHLAVIAGNLPLVNFLLANGADINAVDNEKHTVVHWATVCGETAALRAVLEAGAPASTPDIHGGYPLHYAAQMCGGEKDSSLGLEVLHALLSHKDVVVSVADSDGRQPLLWAASAGSAKAVLALARAGAVVEAADKDGLTALHCAASRGHTDCIDTLLTLCGATTDVIDSNGCTALHYAVTLGHADATALLLAHGADPNRQDRKGRSPAHCGCAKGQFETVKILGNHNANLWLKNAKGDYPLHEAAASGRRELVKWLLDTRPSQVNARNNDGRSPLHLAALNDNTDMCKILLDAGANINPILRTSKNVFMTPLDCALQRGFRSTAKFLQLHGGVPANKLASMRQRNSSSGVSLQIRDDITLCGNSSSETDRDVSRGKRQKKRSFRRKLAYRYERMKSSVSDSEYEEQKQRKLEPDYEKESSDGKSERADGDKGPTVQQNIDYQQFNRGVGGEIFIYANEVNINDKSSDVRIQQNGEIILKPKDLQEDTPLEEETLDTRSKRPKSAKLRDKKTKQREKTSTESDTGKFMKDTSLEDEIKQSRPQTADKEKQSTSDPDKSEHQFLEKILQPDQQSVISTTSYEEEGQKEFVVEASVHSPPKEVEQIEETLQKEKDKLKEGEDEVGLQEQMKKDESSSSGHSIEDTKEVLQSTSLEPEKQVDKVEEVPKMETETASNKSVVKTSLESSPKSELQKTEVEETSLAPEPPANITTEQQVSINIVPSTPKSVQDTTEPVPEQSATQKLSAEATPYELKDQETIQSVSIPPLEEEKPVGLFTSEAEGSPIPLSDSKTAKVTTEDKSDRTKGDEERENKLGKKSRTRRKTESFKMIDEQSEEKEYDGHQEKAERRMKAIKRDGSIQVSKETSDVEHQQKGRILKTSQQPKLQRSKSQLESPRNISVSSEMSEEETSSRSFTESSIESVKSMHKSFKVLDGTQIDGGYEIQEKKVKRSPRRVTLEKERSRSEETKSSTKSTQDVEKQKFRKSRIPLSVSHAKVLSKSDRNLDKFGRHSDGRIESRIPSLPNIYDSGEIKSQRHSRSVSNMSAPIFTSAYSDYDHESASEAEDVVSSASKKKRFRKRTKARGAKSAGSEYDSSNLIDSGFEPSPRSSRIPKWKNVSNRGVNMTSVTQSIQSNIRRYHLERKIFQQLLDLKRLQIRSGQHNEAVLVKRAIDTYHQSCASTVGAGRYLSKDYTFKSFEKFLYNSLRKIQRNGAEHLRGLPEAPRNPLLCTQSTHRCDHATHAYTGVPCAAYLPKMDHHTIPKIGFDCKPQGFLPKINPRNTVTLELCHGSDKQIISLPAERLDQNKRYYVTFTVKGNESKNKTKEESVEDQSGHRHSKSV